MLKYFHNWNYNLWIAGKPGPSGKTGEKGK